jgi:hypothetical protein
MTKLACVINRSIPHEVWDPHARWLGLVVDQVLHDLLVSPPCCPMQWSQTCVAVLHVWVCATAQQEPHALFLHLFLVLHVIDHCQCKRGVAVYVTNLHSIHDLFPPHCLLRRLVNLVYKHTQNLKVLVQALLVNDCSSHLLAVFIFHVFNNFFI